MSAADMLEIGIVAVAAVIVLSACYHDWIDYHNNRGGFA